MKPLLELKQLTYKRPNGKLCAQGVNLALSAGQKVAITGSNGCGKSTLLMMMLGLIDGVEGEVRLFGQRCDSEAAFAHARTRIGMLFQDPDDQLFCPTILEDVCFGPLNQGYSNQEANKMALQTLDELGIGHLAQSVGYHLSGGEKRLASLATILVMKPEVLLLDEPTNDLDEENCQLFIDIIQRLDLPMVLVSHDEQLRRALTTREYHFKDGKLSLTTI